MGNAERAAYLRGLMEGLELDPAAKETKVLSVMAELLEEMAAEVDQLEEDLDDLTDTVDELDENLAAVEEELYDLEDCGGCAGCGEDWDNEDFDFEVNCPSCGETIALTDDMLDNGEIVCPKCGEPMIFDLEDEDDEEPEE